jgi:riboflavin kinase/FMN adenylyltransferase
VRGQCLGRELGFPTANFRLHPSFVALRGIYAVRVRGIGGLPDADAVASLGTRPTVGGVEPLLEVHVFDFAGDLYGQRLTVEFVERLRDEEKFPSLEALVTQMHADATRAREILAARAA